MDTFGPCRSQNGLSLANQRAFRADGQVEADEGSVRFQALLGCPAEALGATPAGLPEGAKNQAFRLLISSRS